MNSNTLKQSPLHNEHVFAGAKFAEFGGWNMPLNYSSGTLAEHMACRQGTAMFDVSHLGSVRVTGAEAQASLNSALTNDLGKIGPGRAQYTHLLDAIDASVVDDIIVWWVSPDRFDVMPNASNTDRIVSVLGGVDVTSTRAVIAVQGPTSRAIVAKVSPDAGAVAHFGVIEFVWNGAVCVAAGTGYTGEVGVELAVPNDVAPAMWQALVAAGATPAGLGARDTLRLEAALPLHGHELGAGITSLQAGLSWVVSWTKGDFIGRSALMAERDAGIARRLRAFVTEGRRPPRAGQSVLVDGVVVGELTSGNYSPIRECGIALGFVPPDIEIGATVQLDVRGTTVDALVVKPPFVTATS